MSNLGLASAKQITTAEMASLADSLGVHPASLEAVAVVESSGKSVFSNGKLVILFEPHKFYVNITPTQRAEALKQGLATKSYKETRGMNYYNTYESTPDDRYQLLERAIDMNREAAFKSISMGTFQIMGFNHTICGYTTAEAMFYDFCKGPLVQIEAFILFLRSKALIKALRTQNWQAVESKYNGGGLNGAYAARMQKAYDKLVTSKWANYSPGSIEAPPVTKPEDPVVVEVEKPVVPEGLDKPEVKSKTIWTAFLTMIGSPIAFWQGLPDYIKIGIVVLIILGASLIIYERICYAKEARKLKNAPITGIARGLMDATVDWAEEKYLPPETGEGP